MEFTPTNLESSLIQYNSIAHGFEWEILSNVIKTDINSAIARGKKELQAIVKISFEV